jgi:hypothetical protein
MRTSLDERITLLERKAACFVPEPWLFPLIQRLLEKTCIARLVSTFRSKRAVVASSLQLGIQFAIVVAIRRKETRRKYMK